jgi:hypothetical protein
MIDRKVLIFHCKLQATFVRLNVVVWIAVLSAHAGVLCKNIMLLKQLKIDSCVDYTCI